MEMKVIENASVKVCVCVFVFFSLVVILKGGLLLHYTPMCEVCHVDESQTREMFTANT